MKRRNVKRLRERPAGSANLIGGRLCLDFVNTMGARRTGPSGEMVIRDEKLNDYFDVIAWAEHAEALGQSEVAALLKEASRHPGKATGVLRLALRLREALYRIFKAILLGRATEPNDLAVLNEVLRRARGIRQIATSTSGFAWGWSKMRAGLEKIQWLVGESAAELLTRGDLSRLRQCDGDDCGWIFEDRTRNRSRHWCDTSDCGNRDRVRRFRQRQTARRQHKREMARGR